MGRKCQKIKKVPRILLVFLFIVAFQIHVQIKATPKQVEHPRNCMGQMDFPCSMKSLNQTLHFKNKFQVYHISKNSVFRSNSQFEHELVEGDFWIEQNNQGVWKTPFVEISGFNQAYWIHAESLRTFISNMGGVELVLKSRSGQTVMIPPGFSTWVGEVDMQGQNLIGVVQPIVLKSLIKDWYPLYTGTDSEFHAEIQKLKERWLETTELASEIYRRNAVEQKTAKENEEAAAASELIRKEKAKQQARQYYLERSFSR